MLKSTSLTVGGSLDSFIFWMLRARDFAHAQCLDIGNNKKRKKEDGVGVEVVGVGVGMWVVDDFLREKIFDWNNLLNGSI